MRIIRKGVAPRFFVCALLTLGCIMSTPHSTAAQSNASSTKFISGRFFILDYRQANTHASIADSLQVALVLDELLIKKELVVKLQKGYLAAEVAGFKGNVSVKAIFFTSSDQNADGTPKILRIEPILYPATCRGSICDFYNYFISIGWRKGTSIPYIQGVEYVALPDGSGGSGTVLGKENTTFYGTGQFFAARVLKFAPAQLLPPYLPTPSSCLVFANSLSRYYVDAMEVIRADLLAKGDILKQSHGSKAKAPSNLVRYVADLEQMVLLASSIERGDQVATGRLRSLCGFV